MSQCDICKVDIVPYKKDNTLELYISDIPDGIGIIPNIKTHNICDACGMIILRKFVQACLVPGYQNALHLLIKRVIADKLDEVEL